jgi:hypothetical protein
MSGVTDAAVRSLSSKVEGQVLAPGDDGYDRARAVWNAMVDRRPRLIVRCAAVGDVVAAVRHARDNDLEIGVRCGGHGILGLAVPEGGLMIDLTPMGGVQVDLQRQGMCPIPASVGSHSAAGWAGWPGSLGSPATTWCRSRW